MYKSVQDLFCAMEDFIEYLLLEEEFADEKDAGVIEKQRTDQHF